MPIPFTHVATNAGGLGETTANGAWTVRQVRLGEYKSEYNDIMLKLTGKFLGSFAALVLVLFLLAGYGAKNRGTALTPIPAADLQARFDVLWANSDWQGFVTLAEEQQGLQKLTSQQQQALEVARTNAGLISPTPTTASNRVFLKVGEHGVISDNGVWLSVTKDAYDAMNKAFAAHDAIGLSNLAASGLIYPVGKGVHVLVIDRQGFLEQTVQVRVLEGPAFSVSGWLPAGLATPAN